MKQDRGRSIGEMHAALVISQTGQDAAVIASLSARRRDLDQDAPITVEGSGRFDPAGVKHIQEVLLPIVERILERLKVAPPSLALSVANLNAAAAHGVEIRAHGFSLDLSMVCCMLSAALNLPIPGDLVATGHISNQTGAIRMVGSLDKKIQAAAGDRSIAGIILPDLSADASMEILTPNERRGIQLAIDQARETLAIHEVSRLAELFRIVFSISVDYNISVGGSGTPAFDIMMITVNPIFESTQISRYHSEFIYGSRSDT